MKNVSRTKVTDETVNRELDNIRDLLERLMIFYGNGTPLNNVVAKKGSIYINLDGGAATTMYVKETGTDSSGWAAK